MPSKANQNARVMSRENAKMRRQVQVNLAEDDIVYFKVFVRILGFNFHYLMPFTHSGQL